MTFSCFQGTAALFSIQEFNTFNSIWDLLQALAYHLVALAFLDCIFSPPSMSLPNPRSCVRLSLDPFQPLCGERHSVLWTAAM